MECRRADSSEDVVQSGRSVTKRTGRMSISSVRLVNRGLAPRNLGFKSLSSTAKGLAMTRIRRGVFESVEGKVAPLPLHSRS